MIWSDHRPLVNSFKNQELQKNDPVALAQMVEIGQFSNNIRFIQGKANICADLLSRPFDVPLGEAYKMPETITSNKSDVPEEILGQNAAIALMN